MRVCVLRECTQCVCIVIALHIYPTMVKPKKKTQQQKEAAPQPEIEEEAESSDHSDPEADNEWMQKYMGDNQMMWFRKIIRAQATVVMKDIIAQEVNKIIGERLSEQKKEMTHEIKQLSDKVEQLDDR